MSNPESAALTEQSELFAMHMDGFDIGAAFSEAMNGVVSDIELALDEKVRRMEVLLTEGASEMYRDFVDFRALAAQMEAACSHDHALRTSVQGSELLFGFMEDAAQHDGHNHSPAEPEPAHTPHATGAEARKKAKKKKWRGWLAILLNRD